MTRVVGFSGTQFGMSNDQKAKLAELLLPFKGCEFHHGACVGADEQAAMIASNIGLITVAHPGIDTPNKRTLFVSARDVEPKPNLERNHDIVDSCTDLFIAPHRPRPILRSGTWATWRYAKKVEHEYTMIYHDGSTVFHAGGRN